MFITHYHSRGVVDRDRSNVNVLGCYLDVTGFAAVVVKLFIKGITIEFYEIIDEFVDLNDEYNMKSLQSQFHQLIKTHKIKYILGNTTAECIKGNISTSTTSKNVVRSGWETVDLNYERAYLRLNKGILRDNQIGFDNRLKQVWSEDLNKYDHRKAVEGETYLRVFALFNIIDNCTITTPSGTIL